MMRQHILTTALAAAVTALAYGQNLNPTVEVTNAYEGGASSIGKPAQQLAVPDSVMTFNLDFDYSVFEKPYQGAYEFQPYYVQLKPAPRSSTEGKFFLRAGAGFTLHPDLDLVWTPLRKEKTQVNVYTAHHSYFGRYHRFGESLPEDGVVTLAPSGEKMKGYLADTKVGMDGTFGWDGGVATLDVNYRHRMANDAWHYQKMGGVEARGRVRSLPSDAPHFLYDAALQYHFLGGNQSHDYYLGQGASSGLETEVEVDRKALKIGESYFAFTGTFGPDFGGNRRFVADVDLQLARYVGDAAGYTGGVSLKPRYEFISDGWHFVIGAKASWLIYSEDYNFEPYRNKSGILYPDVHVDFHLLDDRLILQTSATGGDLFNTYSGRFFSHPFSGVNEFGHSRERIRAMLGARGNIASRFRYDLQGGYARWEKAPVEGWALPKVPALYEQSFHLFFAELDYGWKSEGVTVDGRLAWRHARMPGDRAFSPAALTGFIRPSYSWGDRLKGGLDVSWSTSRKAALAGNTLMIPGWVDLGLHAEYHLTGNLGFWVKGGNLLNQAVQPTALHAEAGMYATAGVLLTF
jgi:hypothetical protein